MPRHDRSTRRQSRRQRRRKWMSKRRLEAARLRHTQKGKGVGTPGSGPLAPLNPCSVSLGGPRIRFKQKITPTSPGAPQ